MGAPLKNRNNVGPGVDSFLATGRFPKGASYIGRLVRQLRIALNTAVEQRHDAKCLYHDAVIQSAIRHEARALLWQRWMRVNDKLSTDQLLAITREIGSATDARDKCLRLLKLDHDAKSDAIDALYFAEPDDTPASPAGPAADTPAESEGATDGTPAELA